MADSDLQIETHAGVTIAVLGEAYENLNEPVLLAASKHLLDLAQTIEPPVLLIDLSRTKFFGSSFLGTLFRTWRRLSSRGGRMAMCSPTEVCGEVLRVTQVDRLWTIYGERNDAVAALRS